MISFALCISDNAPVNNGSAVVTVNGLECGAPYTIIAGGILNNGSLIGPRSSHGIVNGTDFNHTCGSVDVGDDVDDGDDGEG